MINFITDMQNLEIKDDIYERFLAFKIKYKPTMSNEEFIQFLLTQFENCCSKVVCNGYINGAIEDCTMDCLSHENIHNTKEVIHGIDSSLKEKENVLLQNYRIFTCPECKYTSGYQKEIEQHFNDCHDMTGAFPCTCGQCFNKMAQFLAHYIICPIAATDLQNNGYMDEQSDESSNKEEEKETADNEYTSPSPALQSQDSSPSHTEDSNDQPLDFHIHSPSHSNPINLVKNENLTINKDTIITDYSINSINFNNNNTSINDKDGLPDNICNNGSPNAASSPGNLDRPKKPGKVYECEHCEKNFKSKGLLDQHKHLHFPPRHECEFCGRRFRWPPQFYTHKQQCSKRKVTILESPDLNNLKKNTYNFSPVTSTYNNSDSRFQTSREVFSPSQVQDQCICGYKCGTLTDMYEHKRTCVASARAMILQKIMDYKSIQTSSLLPNMSNHNGNNISTPSVHSVMQNFMPNTTSISNNSSYSTVPPLTVDNISPPITAITTQKPKPHDLKPFECDFCESRFMTKISLKQHLDGKHSDQAKYCCERCGKGYFWNASYNYHKKKCMAKQLTNPSTVGLR